MKSRRLISVICAIIAILMLLPMLASCGGDAETTDTNQPPSKETEESKTSGSSATETDTDSDEATDPSNSDTEGSTEDDTDEGDTDVSGSVTDEESQSDNGNAGGSEAITDSDGGDNSDAETNEGENEGGNEDEDSTDVVLPSILDCDNAPSIEYAHSILNGVNYYYPNAKRESAILENQEMLLEYGLRIDGNKQVTSLKNKNGASYVENTMDVFVRMNSGDTYYASTTKTSTSSNLFRLGYYFYEARFEGQDFFNGSASNTRKSIKLSNGLTTKNDTTLVSNENGVLTVKLTDDKSGTFDPFFVLADGSHTSKQDKTFTLIEITMKVDAGIRKAHLFVNTGSGFNNQQRYVFETIADGNYHTYTIPLYSIQDYAGKTTGLRLDLDGKDGDVAVIKDMTIVAADIENLPTGLSIARSFMAYSDKMHHILQVSAQTETSNIKEIGMLTNIREETVEKLIVKDASGTHDTIEGVDWSTVEYIGFDIKNAGIFGYILPADDGSGKLSVTLKDGIYVIEQTSTPKDGTIKPSAEGTNNANDFYMGQRIYTDANHDFSEFLYEAECERNPLPEKYVQIDKQSSDEGVSLGYNALRGLYVITYKAITSGPNDYPNVRFSIKGDDRDRKIYIMAYSDSTSVVESSVLLNDKNFLLPIPVEVGKNFSEGAGERNLYNIDDPVYSESIFPLVLKSGEMNRYNVINIYRKWGNFPLKQVSWIQFYAPYYHLSTGVTETNCIVPWYATRVSRDLGTLPDFRAMSAPAFSGDQKNSGGFHRFLRYTDSDGNYITSENTINTIGSYGPTYADVNMEYLTDDGKIKITYNHMEMPQEDENRTYYTMNYEVLDDVTIKDFAKDFSFYSVASNDPTGVYQLVGYLGEDGNGKVVDAKKAGDEAVYYTLGKEAPYFSYMKMTDDRGNKSGYINLAFLVHSSKFIIEGKEVEPNFVLADLGGTLSISLNYGELTLKKGDKITINAILLPWGSQETIYDGSNGKAPDQNVRDVRQNSILDPLKATAKADCEVIDTVYMPMLRTTNGKSAEFTLSGGNDNCAVRIYGFDMLTAPKVYELIDGEWIDYRLASGYFSYNSETSQVYDGYGVYYDGDGKFSYTFVAEMDNGAERTFKIVANERFTSWSEIDPEDVKSNAVQDEHINLIVKGENLFNAADGAVGFGSIEYLEKEDAVRFYANPDKTEQYLYVFQSNIFETGDYLVIKYRTSNAPGTFKIYTSTFEPGATYDNHYWSNSTLVRDGQWHVLVLDISEYEKAQKPRFEADGRDYYDTFPVNETDGKYYATFLRFDIFNQLLSEGTCIDIQYIGYSNDIEKIKAYNQDVYDLHLSTTGTSYESIPTGGEPPVVDPDIPEETTTKAPDPVETEPIETDPVETEPIGDKMNLVVGGETLYNLTQTSQGALTGISKTEYIDGYTRFYSDPSIANGSFNVFTGNETATGKYLVIKYRLPSTNPTAVQTLKYNISTTSSGVAVTNLYYATAVFKSDDNWQLLVLDLEKMEEQRTSTNEFLPNETDGLYYPKFLKLTIFTDKSYSDGTYIDIEYVAMCDSFNTIKVCNKDMGNIHLVDKNATSSPFYTNVINEYRYLDPTSDYTLADKYFCFHVDKINGNSYAYNSVSNKGITEKALNQTLSGTTLSVGGWCPVEGGISKYMWSVDGKTWYECGGTVSDRTSILGPASEQMSGAYTFTEADSKNAGYSLSIDLSAYSGQTVDVRIAAIPEGSTDTLCVLTVISGVTVANK